MKVNTKNYAIALYDATKKSKAEELKLFIKNFVKILAAKNLIGLAPKIIADFNQHYDDTEGIIEVKITSALELSEAEKKEIKNQIKNLTKKEVELKTIIDKELIGGIKINFADNLIDGSLKTQIQNLKKQLLTIN